MTANLGMKGKGRRNDIINLIILIFIAILLGVYLIATTVMISKDGVFYIERAQKLSSEPSSIIKAHSPGYPFLIFGAHKLISYFSDISSERGWIYTAQSVSLFCRVFALVPLYFIGKLLVGSRNSFWALVILILMPYSAKYGSDTLRDWPHILFLATGFLLLLLGARQGRWWMFGVVGLAAGLGHVIRMECAQLVIYGVLWLLIGLLLPRHSMSRPKLVCALFILMVGFTIPAAPYMKARGKIVPRKVEVLLSSSYQLKSEVAQDSKIDCYNNVYMAESVPINVIKAIGELFEGISNNLMHFFMLPLLLGFHLRFRKRAATTDVEKFFIPVFIVFNIMMAVLLYSHWKYISRRHCLPLVVFTIFYVPTGLCALSEWLAAKFPKGRLENCRKPRLWFFILIITGLAVCTPWLLRPINVDKKAYKEAAQWLRENTGENDLLAVFDKRIGFYAERKRVVYVQAVPDGAQYVVTAVRSGNEKLDADKGLRKELSLWINRKKMKKIAIYKVL